ncbi:hypothetical protein NQ315_006662 [Exocentrus adspersus]|uniref:Uncharacterized protein n=1 Tax=Exocentrus adspersus TaxID=1586481 RepID=A0AAV8WCB7_9CUCU|nr:hypothetical protein NQ315_006662 [Exocentrus adspersus]
MKVTIEESNFKLETKLKELEQVVDEEIIQVHNEVKAVGEGINLVKKEMNKKIEAWEQNLVGCPQRNTYLRQFEAVVRNWREEDKATSLIAALRGEALELLRTIPEASPNYVTLISALERRYKDAHLQHVYQTQLKSRRPRFEETLQQYEADISRMVNLARLTVPAEVIKQLSVSSFIEGLRDPEIGQLDRLARHKSISEALAHALEIEAVKEASRVVSGSR